MLLAVCEAAAEFVELMDPPLLLIETALLPTVVRTLPLPVGRLFVWGYCGA